MMTTEQNPEEDKHIELVHGLDEKLFDWLTH